MEKSASACQIKASDVPGQMKACNDTFKVKTEGAAACNLRKRKPKASESGRSSDSEGVPGADVASPKKRKRLVRGKDIRDNNDSNAEVSWQPSHEIDVDSSVIQRKTACQVDLRPLLDHNDLDRSVLNLQPGKPLTATTIVTIIDILAPHPVDVCVLDPAKYAIDSQAPEFHLPKSNPRPQQILIPLHHAKLKHWTLAHIDISRKAISHYDSLPQSATVDSRSEIIGSKLHRSCQILDGTGEEWSIFHEDTPKQPNTYDCGIYVILIACHLLHQLPIPGHIGGSVWRLVFIEILSAGCLGDEDQDIARICEEYGHASPISRLQQSLNSEGHDNTTSSLTELIVKLQCAERHLKDTHGDHNQQDQACQLLHDGCEVYEKRSDSIRSKVTRSENEILVMEDCRHRIEELELLPHDAILDGYRQDIEKGQKTLSQHIHALEKAERSLAAVKMGIRLFRTIEDRVKDMKVKERQSVLEAAEDVGERLKVLQTSITMMAESYETVVTNLKIGNGLIHGHEGG